MKTRRVSMAQAVSVSLLFLGLSSTIFAQDKQRGSEEYLCSEPHPEKVCTADNTCGSSSAPCTVEIKKTGGGASATPSIPRAKSNEPFCVAPGTAVTWRSGSKNTGFVVDFGPSSPFEPGGPIIGGSDRTVSSVAKKKGCYKYSAGACVSGAIDGMCGSVETKLIITGN